MALRCLGTGMSFGGWACAAAVELSKDPRIKCTVLKCPSLAFAGDGVLVENREERQTPVMVQLATEDVVLGEKGNEGCRLYTQNHEGPSYLVEIRRAGHRSFTSLELFNPNIGSGIGQSDSLTAPGTKYTPLDITQQHTIMNSYGLAFLNTYLRPNATSQYNKAYLSTNHFADGEVHLKSKAH